MNYKIKVETYYNLDGTEWHWNIPMFKYKYWPFWFTFSMSSGGTLGFFDIKFAEMAIENDKAQRKLPGRKITYLWQLN